MTTAKVHAVPHILTSPWRPGDALTVEEAGCLAAALSPVSLRELSCCGFSDELIAGLLHRGLLAGGEPAPGLWFRHGWGRPQEFLKAAVADRARTAHSRPPQPGPVSGVLDSREVVHQVLARRSVRKFSREPLARSVLEDTLTAAGALLHAMPYLRLYVVAQDVEATPRGAYAYRSDGTLILLRDGVEDRTMRDVAHQYWVLGTGAVIFIGVCWKDLEEVHGSGPAAFLTLLTECGKLAHTMVLTATAQSAGTWMTPAIDEQRAAEACGLADTDGRDGELLYMVKIGMPRTAEDDQ
ncbi:hypothetical protein CTZ27_33235 [Streptomyces griseocarneus]|nr:hypothetical protein CTZ27_33235 [Streptomyces griseocarneus]